MGFEESIGFGESVEITVVRAQPVWMKVIRDNWIWLAGVIVIILYMYWKSKQKPKEARPTWAF